MKQKNSANHLAQIALALVLAVMVTATLSACGKKGNPEPPPGVPNTFPQPYPKD